MRKYTKEELIKKYTNKFIDIYGTFNYAEQKWYFEVRGVSSTIKENYNPPEVAISGYDD